MRDETTSPFQNFFNGCTVEVWKWISKFIQHYMMDVITYPCWDQSYTMLIKGVPDNCRLSSSIALIWTFGMEASFRPSDACMRQLTRPSLVQIMAWLALSHYLNQHWYIVDWTIGNKLQWNINGNSNIFISKNAFKNHRLRNGGHLVSASMC